MGGKKSSVALAIGTVLPLLALLPTGFVGEAAALTWTQTTQWDFEGGASWNADTGSSPGDVSLAPSETEWIKYAGNPVLPGASVGSVLWENGTYRLWFERGAAVHLATSSDGKSWTEYAGNPVFTAELPWEMGSISEPEVVAEAEGGYSMWYRGAFTGTARIGYASSSDGITWSRVAAPVLVPDGGWEGSTVVGPSVLVEGGLYRMWYHAYGDGILRIGYAESSNRTDWIKSAMNPLPLGGPAGSWDISVSHPSVVRTAAGLQMLYVGCSNGPCVGAVAQVGLAFSEDGLSWSKHPNNPVLSAGSTGAWDDSLVTSSVFLPRSRGFDILYTGAPGGIGLATAAYAERFVKEPANPLIDLGPVGSWDDAAIRQPTVLHDAGLYRMWYSGGDGSNHRIGYAVSTDGVRWTKPLLGLHPYAGSMGTNIVLDLGAPGTWDQSQLHSPTVLRDGAGYHMWFGGSDGTHLRIGHATSPDGIHWTRSMIGRFEYGGTLDNSIVLDLGSPGAWDDTHLEGLDVQRTGSNYTMWYSGRRVSPSENAIGAAFSSDGRNWTRYEGNPVLVGQGAEGDIEDLTVHFEGTKYSMWFEGLWPGLARFHLATSTNGLDWTKSAANPVLEQAPSAHWDADEIRHPDIFVESGMLYLWYTGLEGGNWRVGRAVSLDGVSWTKRAISPVMSPSSGSWDDYSVRSPTILKEGPSYRMWYEAHNSSTLWRFRIGFANSSDGVRWTKSPEPVLTANASNPWESYSVNEPHVIRDEGMFKMWYVGTHSESAGHRIGYAESDDGIKWRRPGPSPVLDLGPPGSWDSAAITVARVLRDDDGTYRMVYGGTDVPGTTVSMGYAESQDGRQWTKHPGNPILSPGPPGTWESRAVEPSHIEKIGSTYFMWYTGWVGSSHIGVATSVDFLNWTKSRLNPILSTASGSGAWDVGYVMHPTLVNERGLLRMWYSGSGDSSWRFALGLAESARFGVGTLESSVFDSSDTGTLWKSIVWNATILPGTRIHFAVRSGDSPDLSSVAWSAEILASESTLSLPRARYVQWRATLVSMDAANTPVLHEVTLDFETNTAPRTRPIAPLGCIPTSKPTFSWTYADPEGDAQAAFHLQVDDDPTFSGPEADVTANGSTLEHDLTTPLADGSYEWRVETADAYGLWSGFNGSLGFGIDTTPPSSTASGGVPSVVREGTTFVTSATPIAIAAADGGCAGVATIEYRLKIAGYGTEWQPYFAPFSLPNLGEIVVEFRSTDTLGHGETGDASFVVDDSPPLSTIAVGNPRYDVNGTLYVARSTRISLSAQDSGSGTNATFYSVNGGPWTPYTAPFPLSAPSGGTLVEARSVDNLGNMETPVHLNMFIDDLPPTTEPTVVGANYMSGAVTYITSASRIVLRSTDAGAGVESTRYRLDGGPWRLFAGPIPLPGNGPHLLETQASDLVGNTETLRSVALYVDDAPPMTGLVIGTPRAGTNPTVVTSATVFTMSASDTGSGVAGMRYRLDGAAWISYDAPFTLASQPGGLHVLDYSAKDNLEAWADSNVIAIFLDDTAPTADAGVDISVPKGGTVALSSASRDDFAIADQTWTFSYLGEPVTLHGSAVTFRFDRAGVYAVTLTVTDLVGHEATDTLEVTVWNRDPSATLSAAPLSAPTGVAIQFDASASTDLDGIIEEFCFDFGDSHASCGVSPTAAHAYALAGLYRVSVTVTDDDEDQGSVTTTVSILNRPPTANAGSDREAFKRDMVALDCTASADPEGLTLTFTWTQVSGPMAVLTGASTATPSFRPTVPGTYVFLVVVSDGEASSEDTVAVAVLNRAPSITAAIPQENSPSLGAGETESFSVTAVDADGDRLTFAWTVNGAPAGNATIFNFGPPAGTYLVGVAISDGEAVAHWTWSVTINPPAMQPTLDVREFSLVLALAFLIVIGYLVRTILKMKSADETARHDRVRDEGQPLGGAKPPFGEALRDKEVPEPTELDEDLDDLEL